MCIFSFPLPGTNAVKYSFRKKKKLYFDSLQYVDISYCRDASAYIKNTLKKKEVFTYLKCAF